MTDMRKVMISFDLTHLSCHTNVSSYAEDSFSIVTYEAISALDNVF